MQEENTRTETARTKAIRTQCVRKETFGIQPANHGLQVKIEA
jgi:hypothetical protein